MNNLRDYYERALQEFGKYDEGEHSLKAFHRICCCLVTYMVTGFYCCTAAVISVGPTQLTERKCHFTPSFHEI